MAVHNHVKKRELMLKPKAVASNVRQEPKALETKRSGTRKRGSINL